MEEGADLEIELVHELHDHCFSCVRRYCSMEPDGQTTCRMVDCEQGCGARFHHCKLLDHTHCCLMEKVACINCENGCPMTMARWKLGRHLETCPASVIRCSSEWNRWPMHSQNARVKGAIPLSNPHIRCAQLDVALAMRDQRLLIDSLKAPMKTKRVLRNVLTQRYPAVPFEYRSGSVESDQANSADTSHTVSDDDSDAPWESSTCPPGLQRSVCSQLYRASKQATVSLSAALNVVSHHMNGPLGEIMETNEMEGVETMSVQYGNNTSMQALVDDIPEMFIGQSLSVSDNLYSAHTEDISPSQCSKISSESNLSSRPVTRLHPSNHSKDTEEEARKLLSVKEAIKLNEVLAVDLNIESITRYQPKPRSMYTFLCAQEFRRDEYPWHFKNVHNDIHCVLNGWLEQRCPLACYGCDFSFQRFYPSEKGSKITHSMVLESFGVKPPDQVDSLGSQNSDTGCSNSVQDPEYSVARYREVTPEISTSYKFDSNIRIQPLYSTVLSTSPSDADLLTTLPFEILRKIAQSLDSFSLSNLALTSKQLREVCSSLLDDRGIVVQVWERRLANEKVKWQVAYKKWSFSTAFTPVKRWGFGMNNPLADHLKVCLYNQDKNVKKEPFQMLLPDYHRSLLNNLSPVH